MTPGSIWGPILGKKQRPKISCYCPFYHKMLGFYFGPYSSFSSSIFCHFLRIVFLRWVIYSLSTFHQSKLSLFLFSIFLLSILPMFSLSILGPILHPASADLTLSPTAPGGSSTYYQGSDSINREHYAH
jgi:hypothetical protein